MEEQLPFCGGCMKNVMNKCLRNWTVILIIVIVATPCGGYYPEDTICSSMLLWNMGHWDIALHLIFCHWAQLHLFNYSTLTNQQQQKLIMISKQKQIETVVMSQKQKRVYKPSSS